MTTHTVCRVEELPVGQLRPFATGDTKLIVYHLKDGFYATQASCTHIFAPLAKGKIVEECLIQCPFHRARFDIRTGAVMEWANWPPGLVNVLNAVRGKKDLVTYPVRVAGNQVQVEIA
jgi:3-phenylpropionate/trans-cinnamate dioxygenase ferredoxin subunit